MCTVPADATQEPGLSGYSSRCQPKCAVTVTSSRTESLRSRTDETPVQYATKPDESRSEYGQYGKSSVWKPAAGIPQSTKPYDEPRNASEPANVIAATHDASTTAFDVTESTHDDTEPAYVLSDPAYDVTTPANDVTESADDVTEPTNVIPESTSDVTKSTNDVTKSASNVTEPAWDDIKPANDVTESASHDRGTNQPEQFHDVI